MKHISLLLLALTLTAAVSAQVLPTLTMPPDARAAGMGNTGLATTPDVSSQHWNIAKYAFSPDNGGLALSYTPWMRSLADGMNLFYVSGYGVLGTQAISASFRYFTVGDILTETSTQSLTTKPSDWAFDLGYSRHFGDQFSLGLAFRYISTHYMEHDQTLVMKNTGAFGVDLGAYYRLPIAKNELAIGLVLSNIGSKLKMGGNESMFLPMNLGLGAQYAWNIAELHQLRFALDINKSLVPTDKLGHEEFNKSVIGGLFSSFGNSLKQVTFSGGAEYAFREMAFARVGYYYNNANWGDRSHVTFGAGISFYNFRFDLSYLATTASGNNALNNTLRFTLGYTFAKKAAAPKVADPQDQPL
jgi:hypothetical protein